MSRPVPALPLQEYKIHNADILMKEDCTVDDLIDVIEVNLWILLLQASKVHAANAEDMGNAWRANTSGAGSSVKLLSLGPGQGCLWRAQTLVAICYGGCMPLIRVSGSGLSAPGRAGRESMHASLWS